MQTMNVTSDLLELPQGDREAILDQLRHLGVGPDVEAILSFSIPAAAGPLLALTRTLPPDVVDQFVAATAPGGALDPQCIGSDLPWARVVVVRLLDASPIMARSAAVAWVRRLDYAAAIEDVSVPHPVVHAMAHYALAATELALGRPHRARRHQREADSHVEAEGPGVSAATWARAQVLLGRL